MQEFRVEVSSDLDDDEMAEVIADLVGEWVGHENVEVSRVGAFTL